MILGFTELGLASGWTGISMVDWFYDVEETFNGYSVGIATDSLLGIKLASVKS